MIDLSTKINIKDKLSKSLLRDLYISKHLTMQEIGDLFNCSRAYISMLVKEYRINVKMAERFNSICDFCNKKFLIHRWVFKQRKKHYCSKSCYINKRKELGTPNYKQKFTRNHLRIARMNYEIFHNMTLSKGSIIHHIDGDCTNNTKENLTMFESNSEHIKFHHDKRTLR